MIRKRRLGDIALIKQGKYQAPDQMADEPCASHPVPVWGARGLLGYSAHAVYDSPVPLVTCRGNGCGLVQWTDGPAYVSNNAMAVFSEDEHDRRFLYYALIGSDFGPVITGSAQPQITVTHLRTLD